MTLTSIMLICFQEVFTTKLEAGDRQRAMKRLRVPPLGEKAVSFEEIISVIAHLGTVKALNINQLGYCRL